MMDKTLTQIDQQIADLLLKEGDLFSAKALSALVDERFQIIIGLQEQFGASWTKDQWQVVIDQTQALVHNMSQQQRKIDQDIKQYKYGRRKINLYNENR